jgi:hypothetical protein
MLAGWRTAKIMKATNKLREKSYYEPSDYLNDINIVVEQKKDRII